MISKNNLIDIDLILSYAPVSDDVRVADLGCGQFGYLLFPKEYRGYDEDNWNIYLEFMGKSYEAATVIQDGLPVAVQTPLLKAGSYVEVYPGIQRIVNSNFRIDFSVGFPLINMSYTRFYPDFMIGVQRYFFKSKKTKNKLYRKLQI